MMRVVEVLCNSAWGVETRLGEQCVCLAWARSVLPGLFLRATLDRLFIRLANSAAGQECSETERKVANLRWQRGVLN